MLRNMKVEVGMKRKNSFAISLVLFILFGILTWALVNIDVQAIGPESSTIGLASINKIVDDWIGTSEFWYKTTEVFGYLGILTAVGFALTGFAQLISRKSLFKIDSSIIILGVFYILIIALYILFEKVIINYRPVIIHGELAASFPSTHTMMILSIMGMGIIQFRRMIGDRVKLKIVNTLSIIIILVTIVGRMLSGVHWFTDILGGILISLALVFLFYSVTDIFERKRY